MHFTILEAESLHSTHQNELDKLFNILIKFDINSVSNDIRDKIYHDNFEEQYKAIVEDCRNTSRSSPYNSVTPSVTVVQYLIEHFGMMDFQFRAMHPNGIDFVEVRHELPSFYETPFGAIIPDFEKTLYVMDQELDRNNYYRARTHVKTDNAGRAWKYIIYDPKYQNSITEQIREHKTYLYHSAPAAYAENIMDNGIIPKNEGRTYKYNNDRVFLYAGDPKDHEYMDMMRIIADKRCLKNKSITRDYILYTISVSKIPDDVEFFIDIHGRTKDFIYAKSNIPYSAIINEQDVIY